MPDDESPNEEASRRGDMTLEEAAAALGIGRSQVHNLLTQRLLEGRTVDGHVRITTDSVEAYQESERARSRDAMRDLSDLQNKLGLTE